MKIRQDATVTQVILSKRNLLALLSKLDREDSQRTINKVTQGRLWLITAESNEEHYPADREEGPPGPMIDYTEEDIQRLEREGVQ